MLRCENCQEPLHPAWGSCRWCKSEIPERPARARVALRRLPRGSVATLQREQTQLAMSPRLKRALAGVGAMRALSPPRWRLTGRPPLMPVLIGVLAVTLVFVGAALLQARASLADARQAEWEAGIEVERLNALLQDAQASVSELRGQGEAAEGEIAALQSQVAEMGDAEAQASALRAELTEAEATIAEHESALAEHQQRIGILDDCLGGMEIALAFAWDSRWDAADRALTTVSGACSQAGFPWAPHVRVDSPTVR